MLLCALVVLLCGCTSSSAASDQVISPDPMGGSNQPFDCNSDEYFVQVASESDEQAYISRVEKVRSSGQLPPNTHYVTQGGDCGIFTSARFWVLYAGPFASADAACPALLESPPDASIKGLRKESRQANSPCLCAVNIADIPVITKPDQTQCHVAKVDLAVCAGHRRGETRVTGGTGVISGRGCCCVAAVSYTHLTLPTKRIV